MMTYSTRLSEVDIAEDFAKWHAGGPNRLRYAEDRGQWFRRVGDQWVPQKEVAVVRLAIEHCKGVAHAAIDAGVPIESARLIESAQMVFATVSLARSFLRAASGRLEELADDGADANV